MGPSTRHNGNVADVPQPANSSEGSPDRSVPPAPMPRDKEGWRVAPAPDGRGMPEEHKPPPPHRMRAFWILAIALLAINWVFVLAFQPGSGEPRVTVPFSPFFLNEVQAGQVKSIST